MLCLAMGRTSAARDSFGLPSLCLGEGQEVAAGGRRALEMGLLVTGAASRSPDTELEGRHGGKFIAWAASAAGRGSRGVAGSRGLASPSPNSHFSKPPFLPLKVIFLSKIIYE